MLIDWFTVGAQALNFLILVWLMQRFLYKPVLSAIDAREKRIAAQIADADIRQAQAKTERDDFQHKNEDFERQRVGLLAKATEEAKGKQQQVLEETRRAADTMSANRADSLRREVDNVHKGITKRTQDEVFSIVRKVLVDLASANLEAQMCELFTRRLGEMSGEAKAALHSALTASSEHVVIRSVFALTAKQCAAIQHTLNETFSTEVQLRFETAPELVSGIELSVNGQKLGWSIDDYLSTVQRKVDELLESA